VIGHEITHGFDDQGRQFDAEGNLANWWEAATEENYLDKAQCIIWQYGNYTAESINVNLNGVNTQGENIADNGGIKEAYLAYRSWVARNGPEPRLPGFSKFTPEQVWCLAGSAAPTPPFPRCSG
jgi:predicted metalloendopeptidase